MNNDEEDLGLLESEIESLREAAVLLDQVHDNFKELARALTEGQD